MADIPKLANPAQLGSSAKAETPATPQPAAERCQHCGITYRIRDGHTCANSALRPELVATVNPDDTAPVDAPVDPCGDTVPPEAVLALPTHQVPASDDLIGTLINDRFEVLRCLNKGGMGIVYLARHRALETQVAIKVLLRPRGGDDQERFLLEAKIASKVRHPNTVYISDFGQLADGRNYLAMEFLKGRPLSDEVERGPLPLLRALRIGVQIARGLKAVHDCGIVHRDFTARNCAAITAGYAGRGKRMEQPGSLGRCRASAALHLPNALTTSVGLG